MKYSELPDRTVHHICLFGDPKTGKSTLAAQLAEEGFNLIWVSCDNGHKAIFDKLSPAAKERLEVIELPDTKDFPVAITTCRKLVRGGKQRVCNTHGQVECSTCKGRKIENWTTVDLSAIGPDTVVVWDNGTQLQNSAVAYIIKKASGDIQEKIDDFKPGFDEWRMLGSLMLQFLSNIQQAPYNTVVIAHAAEAEMEDKSKKLVPILGTMPFSTTAGGNFDHIIYAHMLNNSHRFGSSSTYKNNVITGSRSGVVIEQLVGLDGKPKPSLAPFFRSSIKPTQKEIVTNVTHLRKMDSLANIELSTALVDSSSDAISEVKEEKEKENASSTETKTEQTDQPIPASLPTVNDGNTSSTEAIKLKLAALRALKG